jgi:hypothetical protein
MGVGEALGCACSANGRSARRRIAMRRGGFAEMGQKRQGKSAVPFPF